VIADLNRKRGQSVVFGEGQSNPRSTTIDKGAAFARNKNRPDYRLGGGSAMDSAKGIAAAVNGTVPVWDYC